MTADPIQCPGLIPHREARSLTQEQAAALAGVSRRHYQRYEDAGEAPADTLATLELAWGLDAGALSARTVGGPDRALARQARLHRQACEAIKAAHGKAAYRAARARVLAADPGAMLPE